MNKLLLSLIAISFISLPSLADGNVIHSWETEQGNCGHKACKGEIDTPDIPDVTPSIPEVIPSTPSVPSSSLFSAQYNHKPIYDELNNHRQLLDQSNNSINKLNDSVIRNSAGIQANSQRIDVMNTRMNAYDTRLNRLDNRVNRLQDRMESGFATVSALAALHPNPRATGKTQIAIGGGLYRDNVAGAIGIFHNFNDNVMLSVGAAYGGSESWAGNVGLTFSFGKNKKNK